MAKGCALKCVLADIFLNVDSEGLLSLLQRVKQIAPAHRPG